MLHCSRPAQELLAVLWYNRAQRAHLSQQDVRRDYNHDETYGLDHDFMATLLELADAMEATTGASCATGRVATAGTPFTRALRKELTGKTRNLNKLQRRRAGEEWKATAAEVIASAAEALRDSAEFVLALTNQADYSTSHYPKKMVDCDHYFEECNCGLLIGASLSALEDACEIILRPTAIPISNFLRIIPAFAIWPTGLLDQEDVGMGARHSTAKPWPTMQ